MGLLLGKAHSDLRFATGLLSDGILGQRGLRGHYLLINRIRVRDANQCAVEMVLRMAESFGGADEWHVLFPNAFKDIAFGLVPWFHEAVVRFGSAFQLSRFKSVRSISHTVSRDGIEDLVVKRFAECRAAFACQSNHWLKGLECLDRPLEADGAWLDAMFGGSLSHDCAD